MATKAIVIGLILLINQLYTGYDIWVVIGTLLIIKGVIKLLMPQCGCGGCASCDMPAPTKKKKKK